MENFNMFVHVFVTFLQALKEIDEMGDLLLLKK